MQRTEYRVQRTGYREQGGRDQKVDIKDLDSYKRNMGKIRSFKDLIVWQRAHKLALSVYQATDAYPDHEKFGLMNQMRRAAVSIPSNIAEGFGRPTKKDALRFYGIADASLAELKYQIILSADLGYLKRETFAVLESEAEELGKVLYGWLKVNR